MVDAEDAHEDRYAETAGKPQNVRVRNSPLPTLTIRVQEPKLRSYPHDLDPARCTSINPPRHPARESKQPKNLHPIGSRITVELDVGAEELTRLAIYHPTLPLSPSSPFFSVCSPYIATSSSSSSSSFSIRNLVLPPRHQPRLLLELAHSQEALEDTDSSSNQGLVRALYDALSAHDVATVHQIVAPDLEWWFHGPPSHQYLMRLLTGTASAAAPSFSFVPQSIASFGPIVLAEGCDPARSISWIHAWTVSDGIITQVREYFNTSLTVTRFGNSNPSSPSSSDFESASPSSSSKAEITPLHCPSVWESSVSGKSVPGLVLAI